MTWPHYEVTAFHPHKALSQAHTTVANEREISVLWDFGVFIIKRTDELVGSHFDYNDDEQKIDALTLSQYHSSLYRRRNVASLDGSKFPEKLSGYVLSSISRHDIKESAQQGTLKAAILEQGSEFSSPSKCNVERKRNSNNLVKTHEMKTGIEIEKH
ncbi:hypothetical protein CEXT_527511 [Caerostris extrusa]|uniref:Uncharacterized protein n=1 Tax=Caerostris extrusa TaxID=172846 RepID=A0AAV4RUW8_CAEEX|nr:hypothetical protein CEXT_527511 [Caerostris extrusa]